MDFPPLGTVIAGKYRLEQLLGLGGMGAVYRARHVMMETPVALKYLRYDMIANEEARGRLFREARSISRIQHPNVVQVFDVDTHEGAPFLVMEYLEGETFGDLTAKEPVSARRVIQLLIGALEGLSAAHALGIVHRDIKPENIFIARTKQHPQGIAKLLDFGVSKVDSLDENSKRLTQTGSAVGTPLYMSVEQLTHSSEVDGRADLYSFGVVLYHALTGVLPFDGDSFAGVVLSIANTRPRTLRQVRPEMPSSLDRVVMKAMARRREDRYANAQEMIAALRGVDETLSAPVPPISYAYTLTPYITASAPNTAERESFAELLKDAAKRKRGVRIAAALCALMLVALVWWSRSSTTERVRTNPVESAPIVAAPVPEQMVEPAPTVPPEEQRPDALPPRVTATPDFIVTRPHVEPPPPELAPKELEAPKSEHRRARESRTAKDEAEEQRPSSTNANGISGGLLREDF